jgi:hypothetical protein
VAEEEISFLIEGLELVLAGGRVKIKASGCC